MSNLGKICFLTGGTSPGFGRRKRSLSDPAQPPLVDVFLNPARTNEKKLIEEHMMNVTRSLFSPPLPPSSFPNFFRLLRRSSLLCGAPAGSIYIIVFVNINWIYTHHVNKRQKYKYTRHNRAQDKYNFFLKKKYKYECMHPILWAASTRGVVGSKTNTSF